MKRIEGAEDFNKTKPTTINNVTNTTPALEVTQTALPQEVITISPEALLRSHHIAQYSGVGLDEVQSMPFAQQVDLIVDVEKEKTNLKISDISEQTIVSDKAQEKRIKTQPIFAKMSGISEAELSELTHVEFIRLVAEHRNKATESYGSLIKQAHELAHRPVEITESSDEEIEPTLSKEVAKPAAEQPEEVKKKIEIEPVATKKLTLVSKTIQPITIRSDGTYTSIRSQELFQLKNDLNVNSQLATQFGNLKTKAEKQVVELQGKLKQQGAQTAALEQQNERQSELLTELMQLKDVSEIAVQTDDHLTLDVATQFYNLVTDNMTQTELLTKAYCEQSISTTDDIYTRDAETQLYGYEAYQETLPLFPVAIAAYEQAASIAPEPVYEEVQEEKPVVTEAYHKMQQMLGKEEFNKEEVGYITTIPQHLEPESIMIEKLCDKFAQKIVSYSNKNTKIQLYKDFYREFLSKYPGQIYQITRAETAQTEAAQTEAAQTEMRYNDRQATILELQKKPERHLIVKIDNDQYVEKIDIHSLPYGTDLMPFHIGMPIGMSRIRSVSLRSYHSTT